MPHSANHGSGNSECATANDVGRAARDHSRLPEPDGLLAGRGLERVGRIMAERETAREAKAEQRSTSVHMMNLTTAGASWQITTVRRPAPPR
jgi:hypothetical protein